MIWYYVLHGLKLKQMCDEIERLYGTNENNTAVVQRILRWSHISHITSTKWATVNKFNGSKQEYDNSFDCRGPAHLAMTIGWDDEHVKNVGSLNCTDVKNAMNVCRRQHIAVVRQLFTLEHLLCAHSTGNWINLMLSSITLRKIALWSPSRASRHYFWTNLSNIMCIICNYEHIRY